jgi:cytochrome P450
MSDAGLVIPDHIPSDLVYDFDLFTDPRLVRNPHAVIFALHDEAPPIFYTPRNGGHWMVTRAADALDILRQTDIFSSDPQYNKNMQRTPITLPNQVDPPMHAEYRRILNPFFSPGAMQKLEPEIRAMARQLIDGVLPLGRCEFVKDIAQRFPVWIFLSMAGASLEDSELLVQNADNYVRGPVRETRMKGLGDMGKYLEREFARRRETPGDDILSGVLNARIDGRRLTEDELIGIGTILFLGGLDTVASALSFIMNFLGKNPDQYRRLADDPAFIATSVEELLRAHGGAMMERGASRDFDYNGICIKRNDRFVFSTYWFGYDDREVIDPLKVDFDREISRHMIFGAGPHRCIGSHLARIEIRVFLEEWVKRVAEFEVEGEVTSRPGSVLLPVRLDLAWKPIAAKSRAAAG